GIFRRARLQSLHDVLDRRARAGRRGRDYYFAADRDDHAQACGMRNAECGMKNADYKRAGVFRKLYTICNPQSAFHNPQSESSGIELDPQQGRIGRDVESRAVATPAHVCGWNAGVESPEMFAFGRKDVNAAGPGGEEVAAFVYLHSVGQSGALLLDP